MGMADKVRENRLRRMAKRLGFALQKSRARTVHANDRGGFRIVDTEENYVVAGDKFEITLDDVEHLLKQREAALAYTWHPPSQRS